MPIFRVKSVKIYTGQKKFTRIYPWDPWQIWGMTKRTAESASQDEETHDHHKCLDLCVSQKSPSQVILVITSILQAAHRFFLNCTFVVHCCWCKGNILVHIKNSSLKVWMNLQYKRQTLLRQGDEYTSNERQKRLPFICHYHFIKALSLRLIGIPRENSFLRFLL